MPGDDPPGEAPPVPVDRRGVGCLRHRQPGTQSLQIDAATPSTASVVEHITAVDDEHAQSEPDGGQLGFGIEVRDIVDDVLTRAVHGHPTDLAGDGCEQECALDEHGGRVEEHVFAPSERAHQHLSFRWP